MRPPPLLIVSVSLCYALIACTAAMPLIRQAAELNSRGTTLLARGDLESAEASFQLALEYNLSYAEPHNNLGLVALARGQLARARRCFRAAIARNPDFAEAWSNLGVALARRESSDDREFSLSSAVQAWHKALGIDPGLTEPRINLIRALLTFEQPREALVHARRLTQLAGSFALGHALRAEAALATGSPAEALASARLARAIAPNEPDVRLIAGHVDIVRGNPTDALADLSEIAQDPRVGTRARALLAAARLATGDRDGARHELTQLRNVTEDPVARTVWLVLQQR